MASISRRGRVWRAQVCRQGQRHSATFDSRFEAEAWATQTEAAIFAGASKEAAPRGEPTLSALMDRYAREVSPRKRGTRWEVIRLRKLGQDAAFQQPIGAVDAVALAGWRDRRLRQVSPGSVHRELNLISAVFKQARREWRLGPERSPARDILWPRNAPARANRVSDEHRDAICAALGWDRLTRPSTGKQWTAWAFCFALETAMRRGELCALTWANVHPDYAHLPITKNGEARDVPLSTAAVAMLALLKRESGPVIPVSTAVIDATFRRARDALQLDLRFHDSRREAITRAAPKLGNVLDLAAMSGHKSLQVLRGYYRPRASDLAKKLG